MQNKAKNLTHTNHYRLISAPKFTPKVFQIPIQKTSKCRTCITQLMNRETGILCHAR